MVKHNCWVHTCTPDCTCQTILVVRVLNSVVFVHGVSSLVDSDNPKAAKKGEPGTGDGNKMFLKGVQKTKTSDILIKSSMEF